MSPDDFRFAQNMEEDGWTYVITSDDGQMHFERGFAGVKYVASVKANI